MLPKLVDRTYPSQAQNRVCLDQPVQVVPRPVLIVIVERNPMRRPSSADLAENLYAAGQCEPGIASHVLFMERRADDSRLQRDGQALQRFRIAPMLHPGR